VNKLICIIGNKGGTGKTSITHMLCHGFGLLGLRSIAVLTDPLREPLFRADRGYTPLDGRTPDKLEKILGKLETMPDWIGVIDGGANRPEMDQQLYEVSRLALLPFRDSHEDIRAVRQDLELYSEAFGVPSQWPTNPWQQMAAENTLDKLMQDYRTRLLDPVYSVSSSKLLLESQIPHELPTVLNNVCRSLAKQALELLKDSGTDEDADHESDDEPVKQSSMETTANM
jgi:chromosome partitioning protein